MPVIGRADLPVSKVARLGLQVGLAIYACSKLSPSRANVSILGDSNTGLRYPKSDQPRSSTKNSMMLGLSAAWLLYVIARKKKMFISFLIVGPKRIIRIRNNGLQTVWRCYVRTFLSFGF